MAAIPRFVPCAIIAASISSGGGINTDRGLLAIITGCTVNLNESLGGTGAAGANVGGGLSNADFTFAFGNRILLHYS
jgi:hypothetical protein